MTTISAAVTPQQLLEMMQAVRRAAVMRAGVKLQVFDGLANGPADAGTLARRSGIHPRGMRVLLYALAAIGLLDTEEGRFRLAPGAERYLVSSSPEYFGSAVRLAGSDYEWQGLATLTEAVQHGGTVLETNAETPEYSFWEDFAALPTGNTRKVSALMADVLQPWLAERGSADVLDVACGHGFYGYTLAARDPRVRVWDVDWANVLDVAVTHAEQMGVRDRVQLIPGDMFEVPLGGPYDVTMITNVLHHFSEDRAVAMLRRLAEVTKPGGRLAVMAITVDDRPPAADPAPHLFSALMLTWTHEGESHSLDSYRAMFRAAGFGAPVLHELPGIPLRLLVAERLAS